MTQITRWLLLIVLLANTSTFLGRVADGAVFPDPSISESDGSGFNRTHGLKNVLYMVLYDEDTSSPLTQNRINQIRASELVSREFYARQSGGTFDVYYDEIVAVPMPLSSSNELTGSWRTTARNYVAAEYGINTSAFHSRFFNVNSSSISNPGFTGLYYGGRDFAVRSQITSTFGREIADHEMAHRLSGSHARSYLPRKNSSHKSYSWDAEAQQYVNYSSGATPYNATPLGMYREEGASG